MSDKYEIQWPLRVDEGDNGRYGPYYQVVDRDGMIIANATSWHPDPKAAAEAEMKRLTDEYGPAWSVDDIEGDEIRYRHRFQFSCPYAESLVAHLNATGYRP